MIYIQAKFPSEPLHLSRAQAFSSTERDDVLAIFIPFPRSLSLSTTRCLSDHNHLHYTIAKHTSLWLMASEFVPVIFGTETALTIAHAYVFFTVVVCMTMYTLLLTTTLSLSLYLCMYVCGQPHSLKHFDWWWFLNTFLRGRIVSALLIR